MAEAPVNELAIPEGVHTADNAIEVLRAWIVDGTLHVTFDPGVFGQDVGEWGRLLGDIACLPFADRSFDAVVCCRLLHHLEREQELAPIVSELVRVSRSLVVVTYWDSAALPAWRRRLLPSTRPPRRFAHPRATLEQLFERAGAPVIDRAWSLRFVSRQAYLVARREG